MHKLLTEAHGVQRVKSIKGDFVDKLHTGFTVTLLFLIILLIAAFMNSSEVISCWLPKSLSGDQVSYVHDFCYINNTYYYPNEADPDRFDKQPKYPIPYYQYIIFILFAQGLAFYVPGFLWDNFSSNSSEYMKQTLNDVNKEKLYENFKKNKKEIEKENKNVNARSSVISEGSQAGLENKRTSFLSPDTAKASINFLKTTQTEHNLPEQRSLLKSRSVDQDTTIHSSSSVRNRFDQIKKALKITAIKEKIYTKHHVKHLTFNYIVFKFLNLANVLFQMCVLSKIFGKNFYNYGFEFLHRVMHVKDPFHFSPEFPIITLCEYYTHQPLRKLHDYTVQCVLSINILIEKLYLIIWLWYIILLLVTVFNLLAWFIEIVFNKSKFLSKYLHILERMYPENGDYKKFKSQQSRINSKDISDFENEYLGRDGIVMLHILKSYGGDLVFIQILSRYWYDFKSKPRHEIIPEEDIFEEN